jgi:signal transduction protein with GAF and PtsI domain
MGIANKDAAGARRPTTKVSGEAVKTARVMVDAFRLASEAGDSNSILNGILDGLGSLVYHDASGVYVIEADGKRLRHSLVRGCDPSVTELQAPFDGQGVVGQVLATGEPVAVIAATSDQAFEGRPCAQSRLVVPIVGSGRRVLGALEVWSDQPDGFDEQVSSLLSVYGLAVAGAIESARRTCPGSTSPGPMRPRWR